MQVKFCHTVLNPRLNYSRDMSFTSQGPVFSPYFCACPDLKNLKFSKKFGQNLARIPIFRNGYAPKLEILSSKVGGFCPLK